MPTKEIPNGPCANQIVDGRKIRCRLISEHVYECPFAGQGWETMNCGDDTDSAELRQWMCGRYEAAEPENFSQEYFRKEMHRLLATPNPGLKPKSDEDSDA